MSSIKRQPSTPQTELLRTSSPDFPRHSWSVLQHHWRTDLASPCLGRSTATRYRRDLTHYLDSSLHEHDQCNDPLQDSRMYLVPVRNVVLISCFSYLWTSITQVHSRSGLLSTCALLGPPPHLYFAHGFPSSPLFVFEWKAFCRRFVFSSSFYVFHHLSVREFTPYPISLVSARRSGISSFLTYRIFSI
jgi:hypothetical protein